MGTKRSRNWHLHRPREVRPRPLSRCSARPAVAIRSATPMQWGPPRPPAT